MTPLEKARKAQISENGGCDTCANSVSVDGAFYCEVSGKLLLPSCMQGGHCMHNPSDYKKEQKK